MKKRLLAALTIIMSSKDSKLDIGNVKYIPRYIVLVFDNILLCFSLALTIYILNDLNIKYVTELGLTSQVILVLAVNMVFMLTFKTYSGLIRYSSYMDALKIILACISTYVVLSIINYFSIFTIGQRIFLNASLVLYLFFSFTFLFIFRLAVKQCYECVKIIRRNDKFKNALIIGIGENAISVAAALENEHPQRFKIKGFAVTSNYQKRLRILRKPVHKIDDCFGSILKSNDITSVILADDKLSIGEKFKFVDFCLEHDISVYNAPLVLDWSEKTSVNKQVKNLEIDDILERDPIILHNVEKRNQLYNKTILVTGGAGSIGSEIVRQIIKYNPKQILVLDQAETPLHHLQLELEEKYDDLKIKFLICDVANRNRLSIFFKKYQIDVVYHAAAYKHVPLMEENPAEAIITNIYGTKTLADLALFYKVSHFVMVSTDKAVNPSNVMGASKRAAEMYVQSLNLHSLKNDPNSVTKFITTRFGNVLGSNGSVVPLFKKQIEKGGPITITHPDIIRYFMTISEACQLVLEAGAMGKGGEIFIFDMGEPVRIMDLAVKMIKLAGYVPHEEIKIQVTGLRPGEKLYEELLSDSSKTLPTHHEKIMVSKDIIEDYEFVDRQINKIIKSALRLKDKEVVAKLKALVPEFISKNSEFECLDVETQKFFTNGVDKKPVKIRG